MRISREKIRKSGELSGTDKITHHGYERYYSDFLNRTKIKNEILEIGYGDGLSIKFWREIFPNSFLNIIDIDKSESGEGYSVYKCDQSSLNDLLKLQELLKTKSFDLIVDDGSHIPEHIILTFNVFFNSLLNPGCSYIIEDIETSYWSNTTCYGYATNYGIWSKKSIINVFGILLHWINREFITEKQKKELEIKIIKMGFNLETVSQIRSITFGHNCICITKNTGEDKEFQDRQYRFNQKHKLSVKFLENLTPKIVKSHLISNPKRKEKIKKFLSKLKF